MAPGLDPELAATALTAMIEEFASRWLALGRTVGSTEIDQLTDIWTAGLYRSEPAVGIATPVPPVRPDTGR